MLHDLPSVCHYFPFLFSSFLPFQLRFLRLQMLQLFFYPLQKLACHPNRLMSEFVQLQFFCKMESFYKLDYFINTKLSTLSSFQKFLEEWQDQKDSCHSNQYKLKLAYLKVLINNQYRLLLTINQVYFFSSKEYLVRCNILAQLLS